MELPPPPAATERMGPAVHRAGMGERTEEEEEEEEERFLHKTHVGIKAARSKKMPFFFFALKATNRKTGGVLPCVGAFVHMRRA